MTRAAEAVLTALAGMLALAACTSTGPGVAGPASGTPASARATDASPTPDAPTPAALAEPPLTDVGIDSCRLPEGASRVEVTAADGVVLAGVVIGTGTRGVALYPESDGTLCRWTGFAWRLAQQGFQVLAIDPRGQGASRSARQQQVDSTAYESDGPAAVAWLRAHGVTTVAVAGASVGGTTALFVAEQDRSVLAAASLSGPRTDYAAQDALVGAASLPQQVLLVVGEHEPLFRPGAEALAAAAPQARLVVVPGSGSHGTTLLPDAAQGRTVDAPLLAFLDDAVPRDG